MNTLVFIFFFLLVAVQQLYSAPFLEPKIVNGTSAAPGEYPYVISYRYFDHHNCGGSIIGEKWILTAAHCIHTEFDGNSSILYGTINAENGHHVSSNIRYIKRSIRHPLYHQYEPYENDIGLVELDEPVEFNEYVQPIGLPSLLAKAPVGSMATLVGWGYSKTDGQVMDNLQAVDILVYPYNECNKAHGGVINPQVHVCAGVPEGGKGQCNGDSGGPLSVDGVQIGTVSWSVKPCTIKGYPGVFAKVSTYRDWIFNVTGI